MHMNNIDEFDALLQRHLAPIREQMEYMRRDVAATQPLVAGIPLIHRAVEELRNQTRQIKIAVNDLAAIQMTSGEADALNTDVDKTMTKQDELEARVITLERLVRELQSPPSG